MSVKCSFNGASGTKSFNLDGVPTGPVAKMLGLKPLPNKSHFTPQTLANMLKMPAPDDPIKDAEKGKVKLTELDMAPGTLDKKVMPGGAVVVSQSGLALRGEEMSPLVTGTKLYGSVMGDKKYHTIDEIDPPGKPKRVGAGRNYTDSGEVSDTATTGEPYLYQVTSRIVAERDPNTRIIKLYEFDKDISVSPYGRTVELSKEHRRLICEIEDNRGSETLHPFEVRWFAESADGDGEWCIYLPSEDLVVVRGGGHIDPSEDLDESDEDGWYVIPDELLDYDNGGTLYLRITVNASATPSATAEFSSSAGALSDGLYNVPICTAEVAASGARSVKQFVMSAITVSPANEGADLFRDCDEKSISRQSVAGSGGEVTTCDYFHLKGFGRFTKGESATPHGLFVGSSALELEPDADATAFAAVCRDGNDDTVDGNELAYRTLRVVTPASPFKYTKSVETDPVTGQPVTLHRLKNCTFYWNGTEITLADFDVSALLGGGTVYLSGTQAAPTEETPDPVWTWAMGAQPMVAPTGGKALNFKLYDFAQSKVSVDYRTTFLALNSAVKDGDDASISVSQEAIATSTDHPNGGTKITFQPKVNGEADGQATVVDVYNGADGEDGEDGAPGAPGAAGASVTGATAGTATVGTDTTTTPITFTLSDNTTVGPVNVVAQNGSDATAPVQSVDGLSSRVTDSSKGDIVADPSTGNVKLRVNLAKVDVLNATQTFTASKRFAGGNILQFNVGDSYIYRINTSGNDSNPWITFYGTTGNSESTCVLTAKLSSDGNSVSSVRIGPNVANAAKLTTSPDGTVPLAIATVDYVKGLAVESATAGTPVVTTDTTTTPVTLKNANNDTIGTIDIIAQNGEDGEDGADGADGADGSPGVGISSIVSGTSHTSGNTTVTPVTVTLTDNTTQNLSIVAQNGSDATAPVQSVDGSTSRANDSNGKDIVPTNTTGAVVLKVNKAKVDLLDEAQTITADKSMKNDTSIRFLNVDGTMSVDMCALNYTSQSYSMLFSIFSSSRVDDTTSILNCMIKSDRTVPIVYIGSSITNSARLLATPDGSVDDAVATVGYIKNGSVDGVSINARTASSTTNDGKLQIKDWDNSTRPTSSTTIAQDLTASASSSDEIVARDSSGALKYKRIGQISLPSSTQTIDVITTVRWNSSTHKLEIGKTTLTGYFTKGTETFSSADAIETTALSS